MTDRLSAPQWDELAEAMAEAGHEYDRITRAFRRRGDEAARRKAEQEGSLECPACGGSGHIDDFKARREAEGGIPADHLQHAVETMPEAARGFAKLAASLSDAPPPPALADLIDATLQHSFNLVERADVSDELLENLQARIAEAKAYILADVERHTEALRARAEAAEAREKEAATEGLRTVAKWRECEADVKRLCEALKFYADPGDYKAPFTGGGGKLYFDCGKTARNALAQVGNNG